MKYVMNIAPQPMPWLQWLFWLLVIILMLITFAWLVWVTIDFLVAKREKKENDNAT